MKIENMLLQEIKGLPAEIAARSDAKNIGIVIGFADGHFHNILPDDDNVARGLAGEMAGCVGASAPKAVCEKEASNQAPSEVVFKNRQAIGDILCMTAAVRDFKRKFPETKVGVITTALHLWDHNPYIDHQFKDNAAIKEVGPGFGTNRSNAWNIHLIDAFRIDFENKLNVKIDKGELRPDIWMTKEEYDRAPIIEEPYWLITVGGEPGWTAKQYNRWQQVVDILKDKIKFVQLGVKSQPWPVLKNVIDFRGRTEDRNTGIRDLFNLFLHAQGSLGLVSMHMHLMAAFGGPCVVVAGAREPSWFTHYFGHQYLQTNGTMHCGLHTACWKCNITACRNKIEDTKFKVNNHPVPKCVHIIEPEEVADAVLKYYRGGRLEFGKKIPNAFFKNIAKESKIYEAPKLQVYDDEIVSRSGMKWGGGCLTDRDWVFIKDTINKYNINTVLEFGAGLSTLLLGESVKRVLTFETSKGWVDKISKLANPKTCEIKKWDGISIGSFAGPNFDMAFVDGPSGGASREYSTKTAASLANIVVVHDAGRPMESKWQATYLEPSFKMVSKGGHRCHLWVRNEMVVESPKVEAPKKTELKTSDVTPNMVLSDKKTATVVTTCRGYGGSERSTIELMKQLQHKGYEVYLSPTGKISGEYKNNIPQGVRLLEWGSLSEAEVDLLLFYTSDTIWNFRQEQYTDTMSRIKADRKVMVLNYQLGGAGIVDWTKGWDQYMFLNSTKEQEFLTLLPGSCTKVLAPATDLTKFFGVQPSYNGGLRFIRHSSQGDAKHPDYTNELIEEITRTVVVVCGSKPEFHFMPARSDCIEAPNVFKYPKNQPPVHEFLTNGNCFFYHLPPGYQDQGPKVIIESMAAGLSVIADNRYGAKDRVTPETGWLVNDREEIISVVKEIAADPSVLERKGIAARERAKQEFVVERWVSAIIGEEGCCR